MKLEIVRFKNINDATIGRFELFDKNGTKVLGGFTLEPAGDDSLLRDRDLRIPAGEYETIWHLSPKFKLTLPLLYNEYVPKDRYILIHAGNYPKDTQGCILLGHSYDESGVYNSKNTLLRFLSLSKNQNLTVKIINEAV